MSSATTEAVGFIGLGRMGAPMTDRLLASGRRVVGFDVAGAARTQLSQRGGEPVESLAEVFEHARTVILMLPDSNVVEAVLHDDSVVGAFRDGLTVIDMSSSEPVRTRVLARWLAGYGVRMIDAPVSGGVSGALTGTLTIMAGGPVAVVDELTGLLSAMGRVVPAGAIGAGHAIKALNNLLSASHLLATSEAILAGEAFGLDVDRMLEIVNQSSGRSGSSQNKWPNFVVPGTFESGFGLRLMLKDIRIALGLATDVGTPSKLAAAVVDLWAKAADALPADADHTEIVRWLRLDPTEE